MSKTPSKGSDTVLDLFSSNEVVLPNKCASVIAKTFYTHLTTLHELLKDWKRIREKGTKICKGIIVIQQQDSEEGYSSEHLAQLAMSLVDALESLKHIIDSIETINRQLQALTELHSGSEPVISTWPANKISKNVATILDLIKKEYSLKSIVTENIAYTKDKNLMELYACSWEFDTYVSDKCSAYLFAEVGMSAVT